MEELFWFTDDFGNIVANDFCGTLSEAESYIRNFIKKGLIDCDVYINCVDDIVGVVLC